MLRLTLRSNAHHRSPLPLSITRTSVKRNASMAAVKAPVSSKNLEPLWEPVFSNPFEMEPLRECTVVALGSQQPAPVRGYRRMRLSGRHCAEAFRVLAVDGTARSLDRAGTSVALGRLDKDRGFVNWIPGRRPLLGESLVDHHRCWIASLSSTGQQMLEIYVSDASLETQLLAQLEHSVSSDFRIVDRNVFVQKYPRAECSIALFVSPRCDGRCQELGRIGALDFPQISSLFTCDSEPERKEGLRKLGVGSHLLYQAWMEQLEQSIRMLESPDAAAIASSLHPFVSNVTSELLENIQQNLRDNRRASLQPNSLHLAIVGPSNVGKSSLLNLLAQQMESAVEDQPGTTTSITDCPVAIDGIPVTLNDTVGMDGSVQNAHSQTVGRMDSADIKICVLDMEQVYADKSSQAIPASILELIDSDTIVLLNKRDNVKIRIPAPPSKIRYKNTPLGPQGDVPRTAFRGKVPLRLDGDTTGNDVAFGDYGLRVLNDIRVSDKCLQECRSTLFRYVKNVKGGRFWLRIQPDHPMSKKALGVRMGRGKGAFDHWEAKVPNKKILFEIGGGIREELAREAMRSVAARIPGRTEFVVAPVDEKIPELCTRLMDYAKVKPLGIWCVSCKTGEGVGEFLSDLVPILRKRYGQVRAETSDGESDDGSSEWTSARVSKLSDCAASMERGLKESKVVADMLEPLRAARQHLQELVDRDVVEEGLRYLYHSEFGVLQQNAQQLEQKQQWKQQQQQEQEQKQE